MRPRPAPAAAIALLATAVYAVMWIGYRHGWGWLARMDWSLLNGTRDLAVKHPDWLRAAEVVSVVLGPGTLAVLGIAVTLCAVVLRRLRAALVLGPRPPTALVGAASTSFPSGHALEATAGLLAMTLFALPMLNRVLCGLLVAAVAVALPAVGLSRVMLNVHYPSDVLAGWSLGYLYFLLCLLVFRPSAPDRSG